MSCGNFRFSCNWDARCWPGQNLLFHFLSFYANYKQRGWPEGQVGGGWWMVGGWDEIHATYICILHLPHGPLASQRSCCICIASWRTGLGDDLIDSMDIHGAWRSTPFCVYIHFDKVKASLAVPVADASAQFCAPPSSSSHHLVHDSPSQTRKETQFLIWPLKVFSHPASECMPVIWCISHFRSHA